jgi:hypothetical protein
MWWNRRTAAGAALGLWALAGCAATRAMNTETAGAVEGASVRAATSGWSAASQEALNAMTAKYGQPNELTPNMAVWYNNGPWKRTIISREAVPHSFPMPHDDVMEQVIDYRVPPGMADDLAMYDGSVIVERTKGELSARCDKEGANFLALNLANEIVTGRLTVEAARRRYAEEIMAMKAGHPTPYTQRLLFTPTPGGSRDPDAPVAP